MRYLASAILMAIVFAAPLTAKAGFIVEGSMGSGYTISPSGARGRNPTNIMIAPGYGLGEMLRAELGVVASMADVEGSKFDFELRPMLVLDPPILPFYGRAIFAFSSLLNDPTMVYGGALGIGFSLMGLGVFAEAGMLPRSVGSTMMWVVESRVGAFYAL